MVLHTEIGAYLGWFYASFAGAGFQWIHSLNCPNWEQHWFSQVLFCLLATSVHELYQKLPVFSSVSYVIFRRFFYLQVHPQMGFIEWENKKDQEAAGEIKHTWETRNGQAVVARRCILTGLHLVLFTWVSVTTSLLTGECWSWDVSVLWYSWDSSPSFRFGWNLPLDPKFGSLQVYWQNHGHQGRKPDK